MNEEVSTKRKVKPLPLKKCVSLDPRHEDHRQQYCISAFKAIRKNRTVARNKHRLRGSRRLFQLLLHQCLQYHPSLQLVKALVEAHPSAVVTNSLCKMGRHVEEASALHVAVFNNCPHGIIQFLADVAPDTLTWRTSISQRTPLDIALLSMDSVSPQLIEILSTNPKVLSMRDPDGATPLLRALHMGASPKVVKVLTAACPTEAVKRRYVRFAKNLPKILVSPFVHACAYCDPEVVQVLTSTIPHSLYSENNYALLSACYHGRPESIVLMLAHLIPKSITYVHRTEKVSALQVACTKSQYSVDTIRKLYRLVASENVTAPRLLPSNGVSLLEVGRVFGSENSRVRSVELPVDSNPTFLSGFLSELAQNQSITQLDLAEQWAPLRISSRATKSLRLMLKNNASLVRLSLPSEVLRHHRMVRSICRGSCIRSKLKHLKIFVDGVTVPQRFVQDLMLCVKNLQSFSLTISTSLITDQYGVWSDAILVVLISPHSLKELHIVGLKIGTDVVNFAQAIALNDKGRLNALTLDNCVSSDNDILAFMAAVPQLLGSCTLERLSIASNCLETQHFLVIVELLKENRSLVELNYSGNEISQRAKEVLTETIQHHNKVLHTIKHSITASKEPTMLSYYLGINKLFRGLTLGITKEQVVKRITSRNGPFHSDAHVVSGAYELLREVPHVLAH